MKRYLMTGLMAFICTAALEAEACTVMLVTKGASADSSVIISHTNDGLDQILILYILKLEISDLMLKDLSIRRQRP